jgi:hypothetical protein
MRPAPAGAPPAGDWIDVPAQELRIVSDADWHNAHTTSLPTRRAMADGGDRPGRAGRNCRDVLKSDLVEDVVRAARELLDVAKKPAQQCGQASGPSTAHHADPVHAVTKLASPSIPSGTGSPGSLTQCASFEIPRDSGHERPVSVED